MIKINLAIKEEKKTGAPKEWIIVGFAAGLVLIIMLFIGFGNKKKINKVIDEQKAKQAELQQLEKVSKELQKLQNKKNDLKKKNKVIDELNRGRQIWPRIMQMLVETKPEQLWLTKVQGDSKKININGRCFSHLNVAEFMENLKENDLVEKVELKKTVAAGEKSSSGGDLITFTLIIDFKK